MRPVFAILAVSTALHVPADSSAQPIENALGRCISVKASQLQFSGVVSVAQGVQHRTYAFGEAAPHRSITATTRFNLGSAAKIFTAVAIWQLFEEGRLALDDPIGKFVDGLTRGAAAVTVRQLLTHTSGLGNFFVPENMPVLSKVRALADLRPLITTDTPRFEPGSLYSYSNTGFLLLGLALESITGEPFEAYVSRRVFEPAGMIDTTVGPGGIDTRAIGLTSRGTMGATGPLAPALEAALPGTSAGGAYSTAEDMQRFFGALRAGRLVSRESIRAMTRAQVSPPAPPGLPPLSYGFGFAIGEADGHRWFGHNGGAPGVNSETAVFPDDDVVLIVLSNRDPPAATLMLQTLRGWILRPELVSSCGSGGALLGPRGPVRP